MPVGQIFNMTPVPSAWAEFGAGLGRGIAGASEMLVHQKLTELLESKKEAKQKAALSDAAQAYAKMDQIPELAPLYFAVGEVGGSSAMEHLRATNREQKMQFLESVHSAAYPEQTTRDQATRSQTPSAQATSSRTSSDPNQYRLGITRNEFAEAEDEADQSPGQVNIPDIRGLPKQDVRGLSQYGRGNIDLTNRPRVKNPDGTVSTVLSKSFGIGGKEVLLPTISEDGRVMSDQETLDQYRRTGRNLGVFNTPEEATAYAQQLHEGQARMYSDNATTPNDEANYDTIFNGFDKKGNKQYVRIPKTPELAKNVAELNAYNRMRAATPAEAKQNAATWRAQRTLESRQEKTALAKNADVRAQEKYEEEKEAEPKAYLSKALKAYQKSEKGAVGLKNIEELADKKPSTLVTRGKVLLAHALGVKEDVFLGAPEEMIRKFSQDQMPSMISQYEGINRILKSEADSFQKTLPDLLMTNQGMKTVARYLFTQGEMTRATYESARDLNAEYIKAGKRLPKDFEYQVGLRAEPKLAQLREKLHQIALPNSPTLESMKDKIMVISPDGKTKGTIPTIQLTDALDSGYKITW